MEEVSRKENNAGVMVTLEDKENTRYEILTHAGFYRGGKIYFADKIVQILSGRAIITMEIDGKDTTKELSQKDGVFNIPEGVPNIFYFPELTSMIETFPRGTQTQNFERYREMKK